MKALTVVRRTIFVLGVALVSQQVHAATLPAVQAPKKQIKIVRTECLVVATEAKRIVVGFTTPEPYARELWSRVSENVNPCASGVCLFDLLNIDSDRDVLGNGTAPSGLGWIPDYIDSLTQSSGQRHHFGFHYFIGANGGWDVLISNVGGALNDFNDSQSGNAGDLRLSGAAETLAAISNGPGQLPLVGSRVKAGFCTGGL